MSDQPVAGRREPPAAPTPGPPKTEGLSQFVSKVFDQLSLSAWLPAAMLVGNFVVLSQLAHQKNLDVRIAIGSITSSPFSALVASLFGLVIGTIVTQAFQFEAIRFFEGYWGAGRFVSAISRRRVRAHSRRVKRLRRDRGQAVVKAAHGAWETMYERRQDVELTALGRLLRDPVESRSKARNLERAEKEMQWKLYCRPEDLRRLDALEERLEQYPEDSRLLPTRLGNTLRSFEDQLEESAGRLEGFVLQRFDRIPAFLQAEHDQFRTRLDMYCALSSVFAVLAIVSPAMLFYDIGRFHVASVGAVALYLALSRVSYHAAVTSARGYGSVLLEIGARAIEDESIGEHGP